MEQFSLKSDCPQDTWTSKWNSHCTAATPSDYLFYGSVQTPCSFKAIILLIYNCWNFTLVFDYISANNYKKKKTFQKILNES